MIILLLLLLNLGLADMLNEMFGQMFPGDVYGSNRNRSGRKPSRSNYYGFGNTARARGNSYNNNKQDSNLININIDCTLEDLFHGKVKNLKIKVVIMFVIIIV